MKLIVFTSYFLLTTAKCLGLCSENQSLNEVFLINIAIFPGAADTISLEQTVPHC